ncbi:hypothetical protein Mapa_010363 [Marchantia paleacea]|nr:hypothetical protein Mapa_010363 [Marchantia paleacea]
MVRSGFHDDEQSGRMALLHLANLCVVPFTIKAAITLGIFKALSEADPDAKLTVERIGDLISTPKGSPADTQNLARILRLLASHDVVREFVSVSPKDPDIVERRYGATVVSKYLTQNEDGVSLAPFVQMTTDSVLTSPLQYLHAPVLDKTAEPHVLYHGQRSFEMMETDSRFRKVFHKSMADHTHIWVALLLEKYKGFEGLNSLVDVGGGVGATLAMILSRYSHLKGTNFDRPHVVANGIQAPRLTHVGGDFFESVPEGDAVWMKWVLHDWSDENCVKILKNVAKALPPQGKLINMDAVLPETSNSSIHTKVNLFMDIWMMALNYCGRERTLKEFRKLGAEAGFPRVEVVATVDNLSVLEFHKS